MLGLYFFVITKGVTRGGHQGRVPGANESVPGVNYCYVPDSMPVCNKDLRTSDKNKIKI